MRAGLQRTDNNMEFTTWPQVNMINQKNYYTCVTFPHLPSTILDLTSFTPFSLSRVFPCSRRNGGTESARWPAKGQERCLRPEHPICEEVLTIALVTSICTSGRCHSAPHTNRNVHSATFSNVTTKYWRFVYSKMSASTGESAPQSTLTELEHTAPQKVYRTANLTQTRMSMKTNPWTMLARRTTDRKQLFFTLAAKTYV
jgi:hypothetical protein